MVTNQLGTLYLVATPIGNLEDMTFRAIRVLKEAGYVFCEDTRRASFLLRHFNIETKNKLESFHDHSPPKVLSRIKELLKGGMSIAYLTDAGMPVISDPGFVLVRAALELQAEVTVVPGASAAQMVFVLSGLPSPKYLFHGFFPRTRGEMDRVLTMVKEIPVVHIFYEAPNRIKGTMEILSRNVPDYPVALGRELTKIHEEVLRGSITEVYNELKGRERVKGECVLAVKGGEVLKSSFNMAMQAQENAGKELPKIKNIELKPEQREEIISLAKSGVSSKDASKILSKKWKIPRRIIYEFIIHHLT